MTQTLTQLIASVQAQLLDDGTRFSTATVTAAVRAALKDFNLSAPINAADVYDVIAAQKVYEISDSSAISIYDVLEQDADGDDDVSLNFTDYSEDERLYFRLDDALDSGSLLARYTLPYTVSGLDSATESTLPALYDQVLVDGACYYACTFRSAGLIETINLNQGVPASLEKAAASFKTSFVIGLAQAAKKRPAVGEPDARAWDDAWHGMDR